MQLIPDTTPDGRNITAVCVHASGGADSSMLLYKVTREAKLRDIKVYALTIRRPKPWNPVHAGNVVAKINELLDASIEHVCYYPDMDTEDQKRYVDNIFQAEQSILNHSNDMYQLNFGGLTTTPPMEDQKKPPFTHMTEVEDIRGVGVKKNTDRFLTIPEAIKFTEAWSGHPMQIKIDNLDGYTWSKRPFFNMNKKDIAKMYEDEGLMDTLWPVTRSCESETMSEGHCGECWWCQERLWAFGKL